MSDRVTNKLLQSQCEYLAHLIEQETGQPVNLQVGQLVGAYYGCRVVPGYMQVVEDSKTKSECYDKMQSAATCLLALRTLKAAMLVDIAPLLNAWDGK